MNIDRPGLVVVVHDDSDNDNIFSDIIIIIQLLLMQGETEKALTLAFLESGALRSVDRENIGRIACKSIKTFRIE